jgi:hypothetical protein
MTFKSIALLSTTFAATLATPALAVSAIDVNNLRFGTAYSGQTAGTLYPGGMIQTWTVGTSGQLTRIDMITHAYTNTGVNPAMRAILEIYDATNFGTMNPYSGEFGDLTLKGSLTMPLNAVPNGNASADFQTIDLSSLNLKARQGQRLAFRMRAECPGCVADAHWVNWNVLDNTNTTSNGYNGGKFYRWGGATTYFTNDPQNTDLNFRTWVDSSVAVPEPASWALMIGGFGLTGAAMRRRKPVAATA